MSYSVFYQTVKRVVEAGMVRHVYHCRAWEVEARGSGIQGQPEVHEIWSL